MRHLLGAIQDTRGIAEHVDKTRALETGKVDLVTFTSASTVRGYVEAVGEDLARRAPAASIGPITTEAITAAGIELACETKESTIGGLVDAIHLALA
jgi:uroporphyrinogen-III synthase